MNGERPIVNLSVDNFAPIFRAVDLPFFKTKTNFYWTWPNELIEPGTIEKLKTKVLEGKVNVLTDAPVFLRGYKIRGTLKYNSPLTPAHYFYVPSENQTVFEGVFDLSKSRKFFENSNLNIKGMRTLNYDIEYFTLPKAILANSDCESVNAFSVHYTDKNYIPEDLGELEVEFLLKFLPSDYIDAVFEKQENKNLWVRKILPETSFYRFYDYYFQTGQNFIIPKSYPLIKFSNYDEKLNSIFQQNSCEYEFGFDLPRSFFEIKDRYFKAEIEFQGGRHVIFNFVVNKSRNESANQ